MHIGHEGGKTWYNGKRARPFGNISQIYPGWVSNEMIKLDVNLKKY